MLRSVFFVCDVNQSGFSFLNDITCNLSGNLLDLRPVFLQDEVRETAGILVGFSVVG